MTDWSAIDARFGRDTRPTDDPTPDDDSDQVAVAPDGGAGGWEPSTIPTQSPAIDGRPIGRTIQTNLRESPERNSRIFSKIGSGGRRPPKAV
jgi:hypothetical protein